MRNYVKQIADPIYGTIGLTQAEVDVIQTRVFQRLTRVGQLGVVNRVFPGAHYSRFAHSLGVCHVAGQILDSIARSRSSEKRDDKEWQRYRLAALLHDVGHYPFSHAYENALKNYKHSSDDFEYIEHEDVGESILKLDDELRGVLEERGFSPADISSVFTREMLDGNRTYSLTYADVISSGLDADRIDYLRRSAYYTGVPYGNIDSDYLISQFQMDSDGNVGITDRARLTADHFLLSRWFEYQQMIHHHAVQAADYVLEDVITALVAGDEPVFASRKSDVEDRIKNEEWAEFDDGKVLEAIRDLERKNGTDPVLRAKCRTILHRRLPKLVVEHSVFRSYRPSSSESDDESERDEKHVLIKEADIEKLSQKYNVDRDYWKFRKHSEPFTKMKKGKKYDVRIGPPMRRREDKSQKGETRTSQRLIDDASAVMHLLKDKERFTFRIYVLIPDETDKSFWDGRTDTRDELIQKIRKDLEALLAERKDA